ncbi:MAG TPA: hypothetical protein VGO71_05000 [Baekduia sp.]|jgi:hypothetical protein|nr:hypothetical protein [Baekduia sp.]
MRTSPSTHRRGLLAGLLMLTASVSGAVAIASGGTAPSTTAAASAAAPAANVAAAGDDGARGAGPGDGRAIAARGQDDGGR